MVIVGFGEELEACFAIGLAGAFGTHATGRSQVEGLGPLNDEFGERGSGDAMTGGECGFAEAFDVHQAGGIAGGIEG